MEGGGGIEKVEMPATLSLSTMAFQAGSWPQGVPSAIPWTRLIWGSPLSRLAPLPCMRCVILEHWNPCEHITLWKVGPCRTQNLLGFVVGATESLGHVTGCGHHLRIRSPPNSDWQLLCSVILINKQSSNSQVSMPKAFVTRAHSTPGRLSRAPSLEFEKHSQATQL